jgi:hypothetical protein
VGVRQILLPLPPQLGDPVEVPRLCGVCGRVRRCQLARALRDGLGEPRAALADGLERLRGELLVGFLEGLQKEGESQWKKGKKGLWERIRLGERFDWNDLFSCNQYQLLELAGHPSSRETKETTFDRDEYLSSLSR